MKVSGFTIARNVIKFNYPILESIQSILPICDEFIVNVGDSEDDTLNLIRSIDSDKIRIIQNIWDPSGGAEVLSAQTNLALEVCTGDWAFYLQSDEVIHEDDLAKLKSIMRECFQDKEVDALRFRWLHFYGSYFRYRIDRGWYQKQDRIIRNNGTVESFGDAFGFRRKNGEPLKRKNTDCFLYHYGWVHPKETMARRRLNAEEIGFTTLMDQERQEPYDYGNLNRFPVYFGTHPAVMREKIDQHSLSQSDLQGIDRKYWWQPLKWFKVRYKTGRRVKKRIE
ncbi:MAG: glycosyltransferase family 2 protein [Candidatus Omnitrophica bacterium]|nr:glycosyltransferase family 2 protein [Candidatus Omnitrophota bacterium]